MDTFIDTITTYYNFLRNINNSDIKLSGNDVKINYKSNEDFIVIKQSDKAILSLCVSKYSIMISHPGILCIIYCDGDIYVTENGNTYRGNYYLSKFLYKDNLKITTTYLIKKIANMLPTL